MSVRYFIENGQTISPPMGLDWDGCLVSFLFFNGAGQPVNVAGLPTVSQSLYETGDIFKPVYPFAVGEWRFNGPASRVKISLAGVTGYTTYRVVIWRTDDPMPLIPDGAYGGLRASVIQTYDESNKKLGTQWEASRRVNALASGASVYSIIRTGSKPVDLKSRVLGYTGESILGQIFKGPTYTGGTPDPWFNMNPRYVGTQPEAQLLTGFTLSNNGTKCGADIIGIGPASNQSRGSTPQSFGSNRILDEPNTAYLLVITNSSPAVMDVMARVEIYEGGLDLPIKPQ